MKQAEERLEESQQALLTTAEASHLMAEQQGARCLNRAEQANQARAEELEALQREIESLRVRPLRPKNAPKTHKVPSNNFELKLKIWNQPGLSPNPPNRPHPVQTSRKNPSCNWNRVKPIGPKRTGLKTNRNVLRTLFNKINKLTLIEELEQVRLSEQQLAESESDYPGFMKW